MVEGGQRKGMADPLRRTLLAKLRGKKSKKGATVGGGYGSSATTAAAAAAANGGREGKEKVLQGDSDEVVLLSGLDCTTERMSTYENCVDGAVVQTGGGVVVVRERLRPQERSGGGRVRVNEELLGVSLQRDGEFREGDRTGKITLSAGVPLAGPHVQRKHFVQWCVGDSIGFGDNSNHVLYRVEPHKPAPEEGQRVTTAGTQPGDAGHMAGAVVAVRERNANWSFDSNQETNSPLVTSRNTEENIVIRNVESYEPEYPGGDIRGGLQSPTFFPTELEICDINMASLCNTEGSLRYTLDSEDEDYYDNEILPFYETIRAKSDGDRAEVAELPQPGQEKGSRLDDSKETDRLRNQLKEAYYLLINAMNDINLDVQQISGGLTEQQATSSCSSHSRDSLCSRLSAKNMDSDSWSSGGDHSPQQVSDTDSLLLCLSGNLESGLKGRVNSKSMVNLPLTKVRPTLLRSASDGAIRYPGGPLLFVQAADISGGKGAAGTKEAEGVKATGVGELSEPQALYNAVSSDELLQDAAGDEDGVGSSGSVNSLTGSSDSNADASTNQGSKQEPTDVRGQGAINKGHGVTVNKMQEWMHKGRLLSSEMKQRIEGSSLPRQSQDLGGCRVQTSSRGVKSIKAKSPRQQQPGRKATRSGLSSRGSSQSKTSHPPSSRLIIVILLHFIVNSVWWRFTLHFSSFWMQSKGTRHLRPLCFPFLRFSNRWRVLSFTLI